MINLQNKYDHQGQGHLNVHMILRLWLFQNRTVSVRSNLAIHLSDTPFAIL